MGAEFGCVDHGQGRAFDFLQVGDDLEEVGDGGVSLGAEHLHQGLGGTTDGLAQRDEAECSVDVLAQDGFSGLDIAGDDSTDSLAQEAMAVLRAVL